MKNKKHRFGIKEQILVIVNQDWTRAYVASIHTTKMHDGLQKYSAKCKLDNSTIISSSKSRIQLSKCMDELATLVEDHIPENSPVGTFLIAGTNWSPN